MIKKKKGLGREKRIVNRQKRIVSRKKDSCWRRGRKYYATEKNRCKTIKKNKDRRQINRRKKCIEDTEEKKENL